MQPGGGKLSPPRQAAKRWCQWIMAYTGARVSEVAQLRKEDVRAARKERGLSREALADAAGVDRSHMGEIERGERNVTLLNVAKIAAAMNLKPSDILTQAGL
jgi:DNA-binding XRE family transcriptional regulator